MSTTGWMIVAFVAVGAGIAGYLLTIGVRYRNVLKRRAALGERRS